jgi:MFS family permease
MSTATFAGSQPWYRSLDSNQWKTMLASNIGWMFDGYETYALILTVGVALHQLLEPTQYALIPAYAGTVIGITLLGWGVGGFIGGVLADYIGRRRTMILAILAYSLTTGLSAFAWDWVSFALLRFVVGVAIGSEWATGASMTAEVWPDHARGRGAGLMQCGLGIGFFLASLVWLYVSGWAGRLAHHVFYRCDPRVVRTLAAHRRRGVAQMAAHQRETQSRAGEKEKRRGVGGGGSCTHALHPN